MAGFEYKELSDFIGKTFECTSCLLYTSRCVYETALEELLTLTRVPVVRLRPAQPSLQLMTTIDIITDMFKKIKSKIIFI